MILAPTPSPPRTAPPSRGIVSGARRKPWLAATGLALLGLLPARLAWACAGCRNPNLPITRVSTAQISPGQVRASAVLSATSVNVVHEAGCSDPTTCRDLPVQPPFLHDQDIRPAELRAVVELGLTRHLGAELQAPFRVTQTRIRYSDLEGRAYEPLDPGVHHRNETLSGLGDPWLLGRIGGRFAGTAVTARLGTTIPLGKTESDPFALGARGLSHQHIQFGTGTFNPLAVIDLSRGFGRFDVSGYGQAELSLYDNKHGFRAGHRFATGVLGGMVVYPRLTAALGVDVLSERPERWGGRVQQDGNLGRTDVLGGVTLTRSFGATIASLTARFPFYRHIVEGDEPTGRLSSPLTMSIVVTRTFGAP
ncbi:MAG TPA: hypothetical protein VGF45_22940 [Polyangia bacterium]